uniref:Short-chain dehydrogenase/reductase family protein n=1 Tax=Mycena chlorophos TaxID=658473 RepID=A0ABQ0L228_MYCCL|nr:short-chain dehydrogenase/reductase family protein [Mycena chlorophos]
MAVPKKIVLVSGGNTGLGYEIIKALYASSRPYELILGTRTLSKGEAAVAQLAAEVPKSASTVNAIQLDVTSDASIEAAVASITGTHGHLKALINNAGVVFDGEISTGNTSIRDAFNTSWDTNVVGAHVLTSLAVPLLLKAPDPRILFMTSGTSSLAETEPALWHKHPSSSWINASPDRGWPIAQRVPTTVHL